LNVLSKYRNKRVFITGHTGFKGSWLALWLQQLGAEVCGYALAPNTIPNHFEETKNNYTSIIGDIRDAEKLQQAVRDFQPEIVFHLAAQPLVRYSYGNPIETYETNVLGTLHLLEACKKTPSVQSIVCITTDKVYENHESQEGYLETDRLGGFDPYSSSKACAEILVNSYVQSYFNPATFNEDHHVLIATARGGNVIGGGDWSEDRLIPDIDRALRSNSSLKIRNPNSVRPWQHVLDCLMGYLTLGAHLMEGKQECGGAWNFGPINQQPIPVSEIIAIAKRYNPELAVSFGTATLHETGMLQLDCSKAQKELAWSPLFSTETMFEKTFAWYADFRASQKRSTLEQIEAYNAQYERSLSKNKAVDDGN